jgi:hypothetical protein
LEVHAAGTTYVSASSLSAAVPASLAASGGTVDITVTNPDGQATTAAASSQILVGNPAPTLTTIFPGVLTAGAADTTFTMTGTNFLASSVVTAGTTALPTTFVSSTQLTVVVPAALLATGGKLNFSVTNPAPGGGTSQSIALTLQPAPATLTSVSPATVLVGSSPGTVTLTGSGFTPTAVAYFSNSALQTTYVSPTSIQFTIPPQDLTQTGTYSILVRDSASFYKLSNVLILAVINAVPVLNSISPATVTAGAPSFALVLTGSNFAQLSTVQINGTTVQPGLYPSASSASVYVPASALASPGDVTVTITNPSPGGGTSAVQTLHVISASNRLRTVNLAATDIGWDATHTLLVAASGSSVTNTPNELVTIDPLQGTILTTQPLRSSPTGISVTDDGSYVYVTLPSTGQIGRFKLPSLTPDITFSLGTNSSGQSYSATKVAAAPGQPHTVAIAEGRVVVYDDGVPRPNIVTPTAFGSSYNSAVWGADATTLYTTNTVYSGGDEDTFAVDANGVTLLSDRRTVIGGAPMAFDIQTSRLVDSGGGVVNAGTGESVGQMQFPQFETVFALDTTLRRAFYLDINGNIRVFDLDKFTHVNSMLINGLSGWAMIRWGTSGLAIAGQQAISILDGSFVATTGVSSAVGGYVAPDPTLTAVSPAAVTAGSSDTQVTLTGRDFTQASEVTWNKQDLAINSVSGTQLVVTIPAALLANAAASQVTVTNGPGTGSSDLLGFTVLPNPGAGTQLNALNLTGQDMAWDSTHGLMYVAVPNADPVYPNTIALIDPTRPGIQQTIAVAPQPSAIAVSDDNQYLYAGSFTQAIVQRYTLPSFTPDLTIASGADVVVDPVGYRGSCTFAVDIKVAPANPHTIAVINGNNAIEPKGCGDVAIYDDATPRPGTTPIGYDLTRPVWGADASTLFVLGDVCCVSQRFYALSVTSSGVTIIGTFNGTYLGNRLHYDTITGLLFSDSGVIVNPAGLVQTGQLTSEPNSLLVTDDVLKRIFLLTTNGNPASGDGATSYTLNVYDLTTQALVNSITFPGVLGIPTQMARWGSDGLAFVTTISPINYSSGVLYNVQGSAISGP